MRYGRGYNQNGRHRRMYELTGKPGWIRYGYAPGFASGGRGMGPGRGLGPCAAYLQKTGQMSNFLEDYSAGTPSAKYWHPAFQNFNEENPEQEKDKLVERIDDLEAELKDLKQRLKRVR